jgi:hypothetical protein
MTLWLRKIEACMTAAICAFPNIKNSAIHQTNKWQKTITNHLVITKRHTKPSRLYIADL